MKKIKMIAVLLTISFSLLSIPRTEARVLYEWAYVFDNGCIGVHQLHSFLGIRWHTYEEIACP